MVPIYKYYSEGFDRERAWNDRYRSMYAAEKSFTEYEEQSFWKVLQKKFHKDGKYLDAGCGIGGWVLFLRENGYMADGIDSNASAVRAITEYDPDIIVKIAASDAIPYANETFDGIVSIGSLEYAHNATEKAFQEMHRTLKPGGFVCIEVPLLNTLRKTLYVPLKRIEGLFKSSQGRTPVFAYYLFDKSELEHMLQKAGFTVETVLAHDLPDHNSHFGLYANWPVLRGEKPYELNALGRVVKVISNAISPWFASAGIVVIAKK